MPGRSAQEWDERYAARPWPTAPSPTVVAAVADLAPGTALDLAAGTGRHAVWLADRGWQVTAVDFSGAGLDVGRARDASGAVTWVQADATTWQPPGPVDLVLLAHVQLGVGGVRRAAGWVAPGGHLVVVGHARDRGRPGGPGPSDPAMRHSLDELGAGADGLTVLRLEHAERPDEGGPTVDVVLLARRD